MIYLAVGSMAFTSVLSLVYVVLQGRLLLILMRQQGVMAAKEASIPKYRPRKDGLSPLTSVPEGVDLGSPPKQPYGLDGQV